VSQYQRAAGTHRRCPYAMLLMSSGWQLAALRPQYGHVPCTKGSRMMPSDSGWNLAIFLAFCWEQVILIEAYTLTIQLDANLLGLPILAPLLSPPFLCQMPFMLQPSVFILAWTRHWVVLYCIAYGLVGVGLLWGNKCKTRNSLKCDVRSQITYLKLQESFYDLVSIGMILLVLILITIAAAAAVWWSVPPPPPVLEEILWRLMGWRFVGWTFLLSLNHQYQSTEGTQSTNHNQ